MFHQLPLLWQTFAVSGFPNLADHSRGFIHGHFVLWLWVSSGTVHHGGSLCHRERGGAREAKYLP